MEKVTYTQFGKFSVIVFSIVFIPLILFISMMDHSLTGILIAIITFLIYVLIILFQYQLVITIDRNFVNFKMGIGIIRRKYPLANLKYCRPVTNNPLYSIGIHIIPNGWLYNVSGLKAIELGFKDKPTIIRIGTNKPEEISEVIQQRLQHLTNDPPVFESKVYSKINTIRTLFMVLITAFILLFTGYILYRGTQETGIVYTDDSFYIKGMYGTRVNYQDISSVDTIYSMPKIKIKTNGFAFGKICKGNFKLTNDTVVKLFIHCDLHPVIVIQCKKDKNVYINFRDRQKTLDLYKEILHKINNIDKYIP